MVMQDGSKNERKKSKLAQLLELCQNSDILADIIKGVKVNNCYTNTGM